MTVGKRIAFRVFTFRALSEESSHVWYATRVPTGGRKYADVNSCEVLVLQRNAG